MKYIVALQNKADALRANVLGTLTRKEGQNTVGVAVLVGGLIKSFMPEFWENIKGKILGGANSL